MDACFGDVEGGGDGDGGDGAGDGGEEVLGPGCTAVVGDAEQVFGGCGGVANGTYGRLYFFDSRKLTELSQ